MRVRILVALVILVGAFDVLVSEAGTISEVFVGTDGAGNTTPAATVPFGMVQPGPDTACRGDQYEFGKSHCSGYQYADRFLWRFSQTHVSGMGVPAGGNVAILPLLGGEGGESSEMDKGSESGAPGYYFVRLKNGIACQVTASERTAVYRFSYPHDRQAEILFDLDWALMQPQEGGDSVFTRQVMAGSCRFDSTTSLSGYQRLRCYVEYTVYFAVEFSAPISRRQCIRESDGKRGEVWRLSFSNLPDDVLEVRVALSFNSSVGARRNLNREKASFDEVRTAASQKWKSWYDRYSVEDAEGMDYAGNIRASLYHLAVQPNLMSDVDAPDRYMNFSLWDTFRAAHPLYTILMPERVDAFVNSLLAEYDTRGYLPILSLFGRDTHCMIGHHSAPVIADAYLKGFRGFDAQRALAAMKDSYTNNHVPESTACWGFLKEDWHLLDRFGYYPFDLLRMSYRGNMLRGESVSRTLECAYDDSCVARFAAAIGDEEAASRFSKRSGYWKNVLDSSVGFVRGKDSKGQWRTPFDPTKIGYGPFADNDFTEGNSYQYTWHVMQDPVGLVAALGGRDKSGSRLDNLFSEKVGAGSDSSSYDVTGLIGQYAHGNEVSHHIAYFYAYTDRPQGTAASVRKVFDVLYRFRPDGLCGNEDCGQMSAWYLFSAMGFYPLDPCGGRYVIGAPQVRKATLRLASGKLFTVTAPALSPENKYVKEVYLRRSGESEFKRIEAVDIGHQDVVNGGDMRFVMGRD